MLSPDLILDGLNASHAHQRLMCARILGLVEETRALELIRERFAIEDHSAVKSALDWAGQRIHTARRMGYITFDEVFRHFHLEQTPQTDGVVTSTPCHAEMIRKIAFGRQLDQLTLKPWEKYWETMSEFDNLIPPKPPSSRSPQEWLNRFRAQPSQRHQILQALTALNNPIALIDLSELYFEERDPQIQQEIADTAKTIYLNFVYWDMSRRGILEEAVQIRLDSLQEYGFNQSEQYFPTE